MSRRLLTVGIALQLGALGIILSGQSNVSWGYLTGLLSGAGFVLILWSGREKGNDST